MSIWLGVRHDGVSGNTCHEGTFASERLPVESVRKRFPKSLLKLTLQFNVVCGREWLSSTAQSAFFISGMIGCFVFGWISDKWGRKPAFFLATTVMIVGNMAEISPPNYYAYIFMRFFVGLSYPSVYQVAFLIGKISLPLPLSCGCPNDLAHSSSSNPLRGRAIKPRFGR